MNYKFTKNDTLTVKGAGNFLSAMLSLLLERGQALWCDCKLLAAVSGGRNGNQPLYDPVCWHVCISVCLWTDAVAEKTI